MTALSTPRPNSHKAPVEPVGSIRPQMGNPHTLASAKQAFLDGKDFYVVRRYWPCLASNRDPILNTFLVGRCLSSRDRLCVLIIANPYDNVIAYPQPDGSYHFANYVGYAG